MDIKTVQIKFQVCIASLAKVVRARKYQVGTSFCVLKLFSLNLSLKPEFNLIKSVSETKEVELNPED